MIYSMDRLKYFTKSDVSSLLIIELILGGIFTGIGIYAFSELRTLIKSTLNDLEKKTIQSKKSSTILNPDSKIRPGSLKENFEALGHDIEINAVIERIVNIGYKTLHSERVSVMILSKNKKKLIITESKDVKGFEIDASKGISGYVVQTGKSVNISNVSMDPRFNPSIDKQMGFKSVSLLCVPIFVNNDEVVGCLTAINKLDSKNAIEEFNQGDEFVLSCVAANAGVAIKKAQLYSAAMRAYRKSASLLSIVRARSTDEPIEQMLSVTIDAAYELLLPEKISVYLCDLQNREAWICASRDALEGFCVPFGHGVAGTVAETGKTIRIDNAYEDPRFLTFVDSQTGFRTKSMLCVAVPGFGTESKPIAVIQLINKLNGLSFDEDDEEALTDFCHEVSWALRGKMLEVSLLKVTRKSKSGVSMNSRYTNSMLEESLLKEYGSATQRYKYSAVQGTAGINLAAKLKLKRSGQDNEAGASTSWSLSQIENTLNVSLTDWSLDPFKIEAADMMRLTEYMFRYYDLLEIFQIPETVLRKFIMAVHEGYNASNSFHNFRHGWSVQHMSYLILRNGAAEFLEPLDILAVLVASICHDIDHPGNNNAFEMLTQSELSDMYTDDAILERHHASSTMKLLRDPSRQIVANLSLSDRILFRRQVVSGIMATDMAAHFNLVEQMELCSKRQPHFDIQEESSRRSLVGHIIHCADLSGQALPLDLSLKWGDCLMEEFKQQSLKEAALGLPLTPFMQGLDEEINRMKLQYGFVSNIVVPLWEAISANFPALEHMHKNAVANKSYYRDLIDSLAGNQQLDAESL